MTIEIPPLRARQGDKALLARHFQLKFAKEHGQNVTGFTQDAIESVEAYNWPGNIREMENKIKRAVIMADGKLITREDLGLAQAGDLSLNLRIVRQEAEKSAILRALSLSDNNISSAAKLLGITRPTFYDLVKKYDMPIGIATPSADTADED
jgi:two-component system NtrC family response regulator